MICRTYSCTPCLRATDSGDGLMLEITSSTLSERIVPLKTSTLSCSVVMIIDLPILCTINHDRSQPSCLLVEHRCLCTPTPALQHSSTCLPPTTDVRLCASVNVACEKLSESCNQPFCRGLCGETKILVHVCAFCRSTSSSSSSPCRSVQAD
jgi:hypothetical protein